MDLSLVPPTSHRSRELYLAALLCAATWALSLGALTAVLADHEAEFAGRLSPNAVLGCGLATLGVLILSRHPRQVMGWLFAVVGLSHALGVTAAALGVYVGSTDGVGERTWLRTWVSLPAITAIPVILALFPDGRLLHRRWRAVPWLAACALALLAVAVPVGMWPYRGQRMVTETLAPTASGPLVSWLFVIAQALLAAAAALGLCAVVSRARSASGDTRQQVVWFGLGLAAALALIVAGKAWELWWVEVLAAVALLAGLMLGIVRHRLFDVDLVFRRTAAYGATTLALIAIFASLDVTLAVALGGDSTVIAAISAFLVALLLRPALDRAQDLVDRLLDRRVRTAVELLRTLGEQTGTRPVSPRTLADALRRALQDPDLQVYFRTSSTTEEAEEAQWMDMDGAVVGAVNPLPGHEAAPIERDGRTIAVIVHRPADASLFVPVVRAAAVAIEHARLQVELRHQIAEVDESRRRIVAAAAAERRRIERDLHDGAQQRLIALALHIQSARRRRDLPAQVDPLLERAVDQLNAAVTDIRGLVRGIHPPALASGGLSAVFDEQTLPAHVTVSCEVDERLDPDVEATAWFVVSEAIANATKHAPSSAVHARIARSGSSLLICVSDRGPGRANPEGPGLRGLADRVEAHQGTLTITSPPGRGTELRAEIPCEPW